ncbi:MAG: ABC transporter substrate-binding protein [Candidatus Thorarchaeota archaeon]
MKKEFEIYSLTIVFLIFLSTFFAMRPIIIKTDDQNPQLNTIPSLVFGTGSGPITIDPHKAWDSASVNVIDQVVETLFTYDLTDPYNVIVPRLAKSLGKWSRDYLTYTVKLQTDINFHDGRSFDGYAVWWNFERLKYFINVIGTPFEWLYKWPDDTPIINSVEYAIGSDEVRFVLNRPFAAFEALLCFTGSGMISPNPDFFTEEITLTGDLNGTGPFIYDGYIPGDEENYGEVNFHAYENYWDGLANIEYLKFLIIEDVNERNQALLEGTIDFLDTPLPNFFGEGDNIIVEGGQSTNIQVLIMNNELIGKPIRQAISHAVDYMHIINEIMAGQAVRLRSPVPEGILYANWGFDAPVMDFDEARTYLIDAGLTDLTIDSPDQDWIDLANSETPIAVYDYQYNQDNYIRTEIGVSLVSTLELIGIKVNPVGMSREEYWDFVLNHREDIGLAILGWGADYNDPSDYLNTLFSSVSSSNYAQVNDEHLDNLMTQGLSTFDHTTRKRIYDDIQQYIVEDLMPYVFISAAIDNIAYDSDFRGYQWNALGKVYFYHVTKLKSTYEIPTLIFGTGSGPITIDPHKAWDSASVNVIDQVVETLFTYDLTDPYNIIVTRLADSLGKWSEDYLTYTVKLQKGVKFHDGRSFDGYAVWWNFERLKYFINVIGTPFEWLYKWPDGTPIINKVEYAIGSDDVRFVLNRPFAAFEALLCFTGSGMISPNPDFSTEEITLTGDLVGTGPFIYDGYRPGDEENYGEVNFHAFENYWNGPANIEHLKFLIIEDVNERNQALLEGTIDFLDTPLPNFFGEGDNIIVEGGQSTNIRFLIMNNELIGKPIRQAISHAVDYMHIINEVMAAQAVRLRSPVPEGILYANWGFDAPVMDFDEARTYLIDAGLTDLTIDSPDQDWIDLANSETPIAVYDYQYIQGNDLSTEIGVSLVSTLELIGIKVNPVGMLRSEYWDLLFNHREDIGLAILGWGADYNDPSDYLNTLFSSVSSSNYAQVNDEHLDNLMTQGLTTFDHTARSRIYDDIQQYIVEDLMSYVFLSAALDYIAYDSDFRGYQWNALGKVYFYPVK